MDEGALFMLRESCETQQDCKLYLNIKFMHPISMFQDLIHFFPQLVTVYHIPVFYLYKKITGSESQN